MKNISRILILFLAVLAMVACEKEKKSTKSDPFKANYSPLSVEENIANVENASIDLIQELKSLEGANAFKVLYRLSELMGNEGDLKSTREVLKPALLLATYKNKPVNTSAVFTTLKTTAEDPANLTEAWNQIKAKYTWNFNTEQFDSTGSADALIIEFPGKEGDVTNTAVLTVNGFKVFEVTEPRENWPSELSEMLAGLKMTLKYNGNVIMSSEFSASYKADGIPASFTSSLTIEDFKFTFNAKHTPYTNASVTYNLKRGSKLLIEAYLSATGDWSNESVNEHQITTYDTVYGWVWDEFAGEFVWGIQYIEENTEPEIEEIIQNANAHFIFMNIKIAGKINMKALGDAVREIEDNETMNEEERVNALVAAINANAQLVVVYTDTNKKIASAEAYAYYDDVEEYWSPMFRFVYADGTKIDAVTYVKDELENFFNELNELINEINNDYGVEIEPIDTSNL